MTPNTVPSRPISGLTEPIVARASQVSPERVALGVGLGVQDLAQRFDLRRAQARRRAPSSAPSAGVRVREELRSRA